MSKRSANGSTFSDFESLICYLASLRSFFLTSGTGDYYLLVGDLSPEVLLWVCDTLLFRFGLYSSFWLLNMAVYCSKLLSSVFIFYLCRAKNRLNSFLASLLNYYLEGSSRSMNIFAEDYFCSILLLVTSV